MQQVLLGMQCMQSMEYGGLRAVPSPACSSQSTPRLAAEFSAVQLGGWSFDTNCAIRPCFLYFFCFVLNFVFVFAFVLSLNLCC